MTLKLVLATASYDPRNPRAWSGTPNALRLALERLDGVETHVLGPLDPGLRLIEGVRKYFWAAQSKRFLWEREPRILRRYTSQYESKLKDLSYDVVFCIGSMSAAAMPKGVPYVIYSDTTFDLMVDYYPTFTNICGPSLKHGEATDLAAFTNARHVVVTSKWAADSVIDHYGVPAERVSIVPIGAQHICHRDPSELEARWQARRNAPMRLYWSGVEWDRKGGAIAVGIADELYRRGIPVELHISGLTPPADVIDRPFVTAHGFVDARTQKDMLEGLFLSSFALLLPSRAECTSVVIADAASFGLPSFVSDTGGMRSMVVDGVNGEVLPLDAPYSAYAEALLRYWTQPDAYLRLARSSRRHYETELSWDVAIRRIAEVTAASVSHPACC